MFERSLMQQWAQITHKVTKMYFLSFFIVNFSSVPHGRIFIVMFIWKYFPTVYFEASECRETNTGMEARQIIKKNRTNYEN